MSTEPLTLGQLLIPGWLEEECRVLKVDPEGVRRFRNALLKRGAPWDRALEALPEAVRARFSTTTLGNILTLEGEYASQRDGATKFLLRNGQGLGVETVVMRIQSGRNTVCVSSQVGCAVRCTFCATGQAKKVQGLRCEEILAQVVMAQQWLVRRGETLRNVVFMGMGEPLLNAKALHESLAALTSPQHFDLSFRHILVSTVGIPHKMVELVKAMPKIGLALSLHSAQTSVRNDLIPLGHRYGLVELRDAVAQCNAIQERPVMIEYLLLAGVNDSVAAIDALIEFCQGLKVRINLIPYNEVQGLNFARTPVTRQDEIAQRLKATGLEVTVRRSLGSDIAAACGQLVCGSLT